MAHVSQEKKAKFAAALAAVMPKSWKYSLRIENHSTIIMTVSEAPVPPGDVLKTESNPDGKRLNLNSYYPERSFTGETLKVVVEALRCLNIDNFDKSDPQSDYFHVGHYVNLQFGRWDKPFVNTYGVEPKKKVARPKIQAPPPQFRL